FAAAVCGVCSIVVSSAAVLLKDSQERNAILDRQKKVLAVAGLMTADEQLSGAEVHERFSKNIKEVVVELESGKVTDIDPKTFDQQAAKSHPATTTIAPPNGAMVTRLPKHAAVYQLVEGDEVKSLILPIEGKGLWSTMFGFL